MHEMQSVSVKASDVLGHARAILRAGFRVQGPYAVNRYGEPVGPRNSDARCFCAIGAIERAGFILGADFAVDEASDLLSDIGVSLMRDTRDDFSAEYWHDRPETTLEDTLRVFDRAIETAVKREKAAA